MEYLRVLELSLEAEMSYCEVNSWVLPQMARLQLRCFLACLGSPSLRSTLELQFSTKPICRQGEHYISSFQEN